MMIKVFLLSLLLHFFADFNLQKSLATMKQRTWWYDRFMSDKMFVTRNIYFKKYRHDYICGLVCHALYWTLVTFAPLIWIAKSGTVLVLIVFGNALFHAIVDHLKCNCYKINLWQDQVLHLAQIVVTFMIFLQMIAIVPSEMLSEDKCTTILRDVIEKLATFDPNKEAK